jgi:hypothetical protein
LEWSVVDPTNGASLPAEVEDVKQLLQAAPGVVSVAFGRQARDSHHVAQVSAMQVRYEENGIVLRVRSLLVC